MRKEYLNILNAHSCCKMLNVRCSRVFYSVFSIMVFILPGSYFYDCVKCFKIKSQD